MKKRRDMMGREGLKPAERDISAAERAYLAAPECDKRLNELLEKREKCLDELRMTENELWDEYSLVPD